MAIVTQNCTSCREDAYTWRSQPFVFGKYPAGNILLSFGILMSGISLSKTLLLFKHIGLSMFSGRAYLKHQNKYLVPSILRYWESYRQRLINLLKGEKNAVWSGDGRYDSMGHSAKYGAYTMFCNTINKLVHFELLQSNECKNSNAMELEGAKRSFAFLSDAGLAVKTFISDRHKGIGSWLREEQKGTAHFYDLWHVCKSLVKELRKACKDKGCEVIKDWLKSIKKHLYWCALSTSQGFGELIVAKWKSIVRHIAGKHDDHPDTSFPTCAHGPLEQERKWIFSGSKAHDKLSAVLLKKDRLADIKKLSSVAQTSCLEAFHSTLNHWHPKMTHFPWMGSYCMHILAVLHFNENLRREPKRTKDGRTYYKVTYPKFKLGEEVVKREPSPPTYNYVSEIKKVMLNTTKDELKETREKYGKLVPPPLSSQFPDKRTRGEAIQRHEARNQAPTELYPPVQEQDNMKSQLEAEAETRTTSGASNARKAPTCKKCKNPMKGHPRGHCPRPVPAVTGPSGPAGTGRDLPSGTGRDRLGPVLAAQRAGLGPVLALSAPGGTGTCGLVTPCWDRS
ncbi:Hypp6572 [Branchiostoma lanceolatum]|uniref:Hypp6572 protein n=1 Tax=Branchiostoma lanceolatum TaxID=7740 RepID=A0A8J9YV68_BRALA|nr:Hypp6572 [Branchiostoma lanceolatum]